VDVDGSREEREADEKSVVRPISVLRHEEILVISGLRRDDVAIFVWSRQNAIIERESLMFRIPTACVCSVLANPDMMIPMCNMLQVPSQSRFARAECT
jgi:hypothetical protein